jgi:hypothetical protein
MGIYSVKYLEMTGEYYLSKTTMAAHSTKIYGDVDEMVDTICSRYSTGDSSWGVLLSGAKGSGKTAMASKICLKAGVPVVLVEDEFDSYGLTTFISKLGPCVLVIDEMEKKFTNDQDGLLSLLDGMNSSKRLVIFTVNNIHLVSENIVGRPGRMHYLREFGKVDISIIHEYCTTNDVPGSLVDDIILCQQNSLEFSFDSMRAIVLEYKLTGSTDFDKITKYLNIEKIKPKVFYDVLNVTLSSGEVEVETSRLRLYGSGNFDDLILKSGADRIYLGDLSLQNIVSAADGVYTLVTQRREGLITINLKLNSMK